MKLRTKYKHIYFEQDENEPSDEWICYNCDDEILFHISEFYIRWKQPVSESYDKGIIMSAGCHRDIADFLDQLKEKWKEEHK